MGRGDAFDPLPDRLVGGGEIARQLAEAGVEVGDVRGPQPLRHRPVLKDGAGGLAGGDQLEEPLGSGRPRGEGPGRRLPERRRRRGHHLAERLPARVSIDATELAEDCLPEGCGLAGVESHRCQERPGPVGLEGLERCGRGRTDVGGEGTVGEDRSDVVRRCGGRQLLHDFERHECLRGLTPLVPGKDPGGKLPAPVGKRRAGREAFARLAEAFEEGSEQTLLSVGIVTRGVARQGQDHRLGDPLIGAEPGDARRGTLKKRAAGPRHHERLPSRLGVGHREQHVDEPLAVAGEEMPGGKVGWGHGTPAGGGAEMVAHGDAEGVDELDVGGVGGAEGSEQRGEGGPRRMAAEGLGGGPTDDRVVIGEHPRHRRRPLAIEARPPSRGIESLDEMDPHHRLWVVREPLDAECIEPVEPSEDPGREGPSGRRRCGVGGEQEAVAGDALVGRTEGQQPLEGEPTDGVIGRREEREELLGGSSRDVDRRCSAGLRRALPLPHHPPDPPPLPIAARVKEIDFVVADDAVVEVGDIEGTVGAHLEIDRPKPPVVANKKIFRGLDPRRRSLPPEPVAVNGVRDHVADEQVSLVVGGKAF